MQDHLLGKHGAGPFMDVMSAVTAPKNVIMVVRSPATRWFCDAVDPSVAK